MYFVSQSVCLLTSLLKLYPIKVLLHGIGLLPIITGSKEVLTFHQGEDSLNPPIEMKSGLNMIFSYDFILDC